MSSELLEETEGGEDEERWLITYADMITLLMAFFIMMYAMSRVDQGKFSALATSVRTEFSGSGLPAGEDMALVNRGLATSLGIVNGTRYGLQENIKRGLDKSIGDEELRDHIEVLELDGNLIIRVISDDVLFASGSAQLTEAHREILTHVAQILRLLPFDIRVEGHTDNVPIHTAQFPSNWELSTRRATNVVLNLVRVQGVDPDRISATGYADTRPVGSNTTAEGRRQNRRIDIIIFTNKSAPEDSAQMPADYQDAPAEPGNIVPPVDIRRIN
jgi:chemotaxis protein MotB